MDLSKEDRQTLRRTWKQLHDAKANQAWHHLLYDLLRNRIPTTSFAPLKNPRKLGPQGKHPYSALERSLAELRYWILRVAKQRFTFTPAGGILSGDEPLDLTLSGLKLTLPARAAQEILHITSYTELMPKAEVTASV